MAELTKDFSNLVGRGQNFVSWIFTLNVNGLQNAYKTTLFKNFGAKRLFSNRFVYTINKNPNSPQENKIFFPNLEVLHIVVDGSRRPRTNFP